MMVTAVCVFAASATAQDGEEAGEASTANPQTEAERLGYAIGFSMSQQVMQSFGDRPDDLDFEMLVQAIQDGLAAREPAMSLDAQRSTLGAWQQAEQQRLAGQQQEAAVRNLAESEAFLNANLSEEGVQVTESGLQYRVIEEGAGDPPTANDTVSVHYEGRLVNGRVFDSSIQRGQPAEFGVRQVIPGWTEALQLMRPGAKYELFIPPALAYGEQGAPGAIPPNAALIFEVELLAVNP